MTKQHFYCLLSTLPSQELLRSPKKITKFSMSTKNKTTNNNNWQLSTQRVLYKGFNPKQISLSQTFFSQTLYRTKPCFLQEAHTGHVIRLKGHTSNQKGLQFLERIGSKEAAAAAQWVAPAGGTGSLAPHPVKWLRASRGAQPRPGALVWVSWLPGS